MVDRSIRMDERTNRLVTDLAYFLRSSKKSILHDAVAEFAETHHPRLLGTRDDGRSDSDGRPSASGGGVAGGDGIAGDDRIRSGDGVERGGGAASGDGIGSGGGVASGDRTAGGGGAATGDGIAGDDRIRSGAGIAGGDGTAGGGGVAGGGGSAGGDELAEARARGVTFEALDPLDRLALRRRELVRRFAERGGTNVRVLDPTVEPGASAGSPTRIVLLAETDPVDGSAAVPALEEIARRVLGVHATVVSLTALRMFGSGRDNRALAQSRPL